MVCKNCGNNLDDDSVFCKICGTPTEKNATVKAEEKHEKTAEEIEKIKSKGAWLIQLVTLGIVIIFALIVVIIYKCGPSQDTGYKNYQNLGTANYYYLSLGRSSCRRGKASFPRPAGKKSMIFCQHSVPKTVMRF